MLASRALALCALVGASTIGYDGANAQSRSTGVEQPNNGRPSASDGRSSNQRRGASSSDNPAAMMQKYLDQNARDQDAQARQRDAEELKRLQEENQRLRNTEQQLQQKSRAAEGSGARKGGQASSGGDGGNQDGNSGDGSNMANAPFQKLNPDGNHEGKACAYFTKPAIREDGGGLNYYGEGAFSAYGKWMYKCEYGRWTNKGPASMWPKSDADRLRAESQERSTLNSGSYFEKD